MCLPKFIRNLLCIGASFLLVATIAVACEWDYDTLQMERQRFPDALELITGKFLRHSDELYLWRIEDRKNRLNGDGPKPLSLYDDLAVAYDKTGQHDLAVETILEKPERIDRSYETYANLGTFHIHAGRHEEGVKHLKRAIEINPDAHFGREIYQQLLVEYVISKKADGQIRLPLTGDDFNPYSQSGFAKFVFASRNIEDSQEARAEEATLALKGVLGMMRFGNYRSPVLLEAVGDLLLADWNNDAKRLAARAYLKASYEATKPAAKAAYLNMSKASLSMQTTQPTTSKQLPFKQLESQFAAEIEDAQSWYESVRADELRWIEDGVDVDAAFTEKYYANKSAHAIQVESTNSSSSLYWMFGAAGGAVLMLVVLYYRSSNRSEKSS